MASFFHPPVSGALGHSSPWRELSGSFSDWKVHVKCASCPPRWRKRCAAGVVKLPLPCCPEGFGLV